MIPTPWRWRRRMRGDTRRRAWFCSRATIGRALSSIPTWAAERRGSWRRTPGPRSWFHWKSLKRQIRIAREAVVVSAAEADAYFFNAAERLSNRGLGLPFSPNPWKAGSPLTTHCDVYGQIWRRRDAGPAFWARFRLRREGLEFWEDSPFRRDRIVHEPVAAVERGVFIREGFNTR